MRRYEDGDPETFALRHAPLHGEPTSHKAALSMAEHAAVQRQQILDSLVNEGAATCDELDVRLGFRPTTAGRRLPDLVRDGLVQRVDGVTRKTRSGRAASVFKVIELNSYWRRSA